MGRMLEALRWNENKPVGEIHAPLHVIDPGEEPLVDSDDMPFIEVGSAKPIEASADVLAATPRLRVAPPPPTDSGPVMAPPSLAEPAPLTVALRPVTSSAPLPPADRFASDLIAFHEPRHPASEEYRRLASALRPAGGKLSLVVLFTGIRSESGSTNVVLNLAITLALHEGARVVVVETDDHRPALAERLGLRGSVGLAEVLAGTESLERALLDSGIDNLSVLPGGQSDAERPIRPGDAIRPVLRQLRDRFDVVLIDAGPNPADLGRAADAVYLIVPRHEADTPAIDARARELLQNGLPLRGSIVTGR
jgi:Mrp family chromosome partitioning ATPase